MQSGASNVVGQPVNWTDGLPPADREIFDRIIAPAAPKTKNGMHYNEGFRFFCLGETGGGKTSLMRAVIYYTLAKRWAEFALIHDAKGIFPEYPQSLQFPTVQSFIGRGGFKPGDIPVASFRGDPRRDMLVTAEDVASYSKFLAQRGRTSGAQWQVVSHLLVIEELAALASEGRKHVAAPSALWALEQGRKVGVSIVGTTQSPRKVPLDILEQASAIAIFRLTVGGNYLGERLHWDPRMIATIVGPNHEGLPNFQFVLYVKGESWDGKIHCLDRRTVAMFE